VSLAIFFNSSILSSLLKFPPSVSAALLTVDWTKTSGSNAWEALGKKNNTEHFEDGDYIASRLAAGIDFRAKNIESFDNLEKNAIDFYASVKSLYLQDRQQKILNSNGIIEAMDDSDWDEIEN